MFTNDAEGATQVHQFCPVQMQGVKRGPTGGGAADDERKVFAPGKVTRPLLPAGMKQGALEAQPAERPASLDYA